MIIQEEIITKAQSSFKAKKILAEIVVAGGYLATELCYGFVVYSKNKMGKVIEQVFVRKVEDRDFQIIKRTIKGGK